MGCVSGRGWALMRREAAVNSVPSPRRTILRFFSGACLQMCACGGLKCVFFSQRITARQQRAGVGCHASSTRHLIKDKSFRSTRHLTKYTSFLDRAGIFDFQIIAEGEKIWEPQNTFREFSSFIQRKPSHVAPGFSGIPADLFKQAPTSLQGRIYLLVNEMMMIAFITFKSSLVPLFEGL